MLIIYNNIVLQFIIKTTLFYSYIYLYYRNYIWQDNKYPKYYSKMITLPIGDLNVYFTLPYQVELARHKM